MLLSGVLVLDVYFDEVGVIPTLLDTKCSRLFWIDKVIDLDERDAGTAVGHSLFHAKLGGIDNLKLTLDHAHQPEQEKKHA